MTYTQHPLSAAFPAMGADELRMRLDGLLPSNREFIDRVVASEWFKGLTGSQRAAYVVIWFNVAPRYARMAAEQTRIAIAKAMA